MCYLKAINALLPFVRSGFSSYPWIPPWFQYISLHLLKSETVFTEVVLGWEEQLGEGSPTGQTVCFREPRINPCATLTTVGKARFPSTHCGLFGWAWELNWHKTDEQGKSTQVYINFMWLRGPWKRNEDSRKQQNLNAMILHWTKNFGKVTKIFRGS